MMSLKISVAGVGLIVILLLYDWGTFAIMSTINGVE